MHIRLIAIGHKLPDWVDTACKDYLRRLPPEMKLETVLLAPVRRGKKPDIARIIEQEAEKILAAVPPGSRLVLLDVDGRQVATAQIAEMLNEWMHSGQDVTLVIGGPDGVAGTLHDRAQQILSLSELTFPHTLVHIMIIEQLYRAWSMLNNHPYHRG